MEDDALIHKCKCTIPIISGFNGVELNNLQRARPCYWCKTCGAIITIICEDCIYFRGRVHKDSCLCDKEENQILIPETCEKYKIFPTEEDYDEDGMATYGGSKI